MKKKLHFVLVSSLILSSCSLSALDEAKTTETEDIPELSEAPAAEETLESIQLNNISFQIESETAETLSVTDEGLYIFYPESGGLFCVYEIEPFGIYGNSDIQSSYFYAFKQTLKDEYDDYTELNAQKIEQNGLYGFEINFCYKDSEYSVLRGDFTYLEDESSGYIFSYQSIEMDAHEWFQEYCSVINSVSYSPETSFNDLRPDSTAGNSSSEDIDDVITDITLDSLDSDNFVEEAKDAEESSKTIVVADDDDESSGGKEAEQVKSDIAETQTSSETPGTFASFAYEGSGDSVISIDTPDVPFFFRITGNAEGRFFAVKAYDSKDNYIALLVNTGEPYEGIVTDGKFATTVLEIASESTWKIELIPYTELPTIGKSETLNGSGDMIVYVTSYGKTMEISGNLDERFFAVKAYDLNWRYDDLLVNTGDSYSGRVKLSTRHGVTLLEVESDSNWTLVMEE